jgi:hypothetical protein
MSEPKDIIFLPKTAEDGQEVADIFGNIWEFNTEQQEWVKTRFLQDSDVVTEENDGLITPEIFSFIDDLEDDVNDGVYDWMKLRVNDELNFGYFYYFYSSDRLIKFKPLLDVDGKMKLFIEINKRELHRKLLLRTCVGPKGLKGQDGDDGRTGDPARNEIFVDPIAINGNELLFVINNVTAPIDTNISVRLFRNGSEKIEVIIPLDPTEPVSFISEDFAIDETASNAVYDIEDEKASGLIVLSDDVFDGDWQLKARQIGPDGDPGEDGSDFLTVEDTIVDDPLITYQSSLINMRNSGDTLFKMTTDVTGDICVGILTPVLTEACGSDIAGLSFRSVLENPLVAVERSTKNCREIDKFKFVAQDFRPDLTFPHWVPTKQCMDQQRFDLAYLDWVNETSPQAPFTFLNDPRPDETCCQDKLFLCPNAGDACQISGTVGSPVDISDPTDFTDPVDPSPPPVSPSPSPLLDHGAAAVLGVEALLEGTVSNIDPYKTNTLSGQMVNDTTTGEVTETILNLENRVNNISYIHTFWNKMITANVEDANVYLIIKPLTSPGGVASKSNVGDPIKIPIDLSIKSDLREQIGLGMFVNRSEPTYGFVFSLASDHEDDFRVEGDLASAFVY